MNFELSETSPASIIPQTVTVLVDSRDRDPEVYPHAHTYRVHLPAPLRDVTAARVVSAEIPDTVYTFSSTDGNTTLDLTVAGESRSITIPDGRYRIETLCASVESALNEAFDSVDIGINVNPDSASRLVTIEAPLYPNVPVVLQTSQTSTKDLAWYLGFRHATTGTGRIVSQEAATTNVEHYVYMHIRNMNDNIECGNAGKVFAKIPRKDTTQADAYDVTFYDRLITKNRLNPTMAKLDWLDIQWTQYDGQPIRDMGEHAVTLEFWCSQTTH